MRISTAKARVANALEVELQAVASARVSYILPIWEKGNQGQATVQIHFFPSLFDVRGAEGRL